MFTPIENLPDGAIGFVASGRITSTDQCEVLEPTIDGALSARGKVRLLYCTAPDFAGYDEGAAFDDAVFGTRHFTDFAKIAFVAEEGPYDRAVHALDGLMPARVRVFRTGELEAAKEWLAE
jgi:SpoIIAA-like